MHKILLVAYTIYNDHKIKIALKKKISQPNFRTTILANLESGQVRALSSYTKENISLSKAGGNYFTRGFTELIETTGLTEASQGLFNLPRIGKGENKD